MTAVSFQVPSVGDKLTPAERKALADCSAGIPTSLMTAAAAKPRVPTATTPVIDNDVDFAEGLHHLASNAGHTSSPNNNH